jgi:transposase-like protein
MPSRAKQIDRTVAKLPSIPKDLVKQFLTGPMTAEAVNATSLAFKQALIEASLDAELTHHLGYPAGGEKPPASANGRNGSTAKTVLAGDGAMRIATPRDRDGSFDPVLLPKHARRFTAFDDCIVALYARGLTVREIQGYLAEAYGTEVGHDLISTVTDSVHKEVTAWQSRPLETVYPVVFFDAMRVKVREDNVVRNKAVHLALGIRRDGSREVLGIWIETTEGAKFWLKVFNELKSRGVQDILIAVTDGLTGMPQALEAAFPRTTLQTCIVHLIRNSLDYASWKDRKALAAALRPIYAAASAEAAEAALEAFGEGEWGRKFPTVAAAWRRAWAQVIPFFTFPPEIRRVIYTTNAIESLNARVRKIIKTRGHFPTDEAASKLIWLALRNITADWGRPAHNWKEAMNQFAILYDGRFNAAA